MSDRYFINTINIVVLIAFAGDYLVELCLASNRWLFVRKQWPNLLIVLTQAVAVIPALAPVGFFRVFRVARGFRPIVVFVRVIAIGGAASRNGRDILRRHAVGYALGLAGFTWVSAAVVF